jgi:ATP-dependent Clp protease protease subunit
MNTKKKSVIKKTSKKKKKSKKGRANNLASLFASNLENVLLISGRQVFLNGAIDNQLASKVCKDIMTLDQLEPTAPIILNINSGGGSVTDGLAIIDTMRTVKAPVVTIVSGMAASMAGIISISGFKRFITYNSFWMGHEMFTGNCDYISKFNARVEWSNKLWNLLIEHVKKYTKLSLDELKLLQSGELWLSATECKEKGIVDAII